MEFRDYLYAFLIGGGICVIGQLLMSYTNLTPARILVLFVTVGVFLAAFGLYEPLVKLAGAGATTPLTGFGYALGKGAIEAAGKNGVLGAFTGGSSPRLAASRRRCSSARSTRSYSNRKRRNNAS